MRVQIEIPLTWIIMVLYPVTALLFFYFKNTFYFKRGENNFLVNIF